MINFSPVAIAFLTVLTSSANAIPLDNFGDYNSTFTRGVNVQSFDGTRLSDSTVQLNASAFGGTRSIEMSTVQAATPAQGGEVHLGYSAGFGNPNSISVNSSLSGTAKTLLSYDGDDKVGLTNFSGLNLNLKDGNADRLLFDVHYDLPFNSAPMNLEFTFYDKSDPTGNTFSRGLYTVDQRYQNPSFSTLSLAFSAFSIFGSNGAANLNNIGAFSVMFDGSNAPAADFAFSNFRTNGSNASVPEPMTVGLLASGFAGLVRRKRRAQS